MKKPQNHMGTPIRALAKEILISCQGAHRFANGLEG